MNPIDHLQQLSSFLEASLHCVKTKKTTVSDKLSTMTFATESKRTEEMSRSLLQQEKCLLGFVIVCNVT